MNLERNPLLLPLAGILTHRGVKVIFNCQMNRDLTPRMKELNITAPLLAYHRLDEKRRVLVGIGNVLLDWVTPLRHRGIKLVMLSREGLTENCEQHADDICQHIYRVSVEDLREMLSAGMNHRAIEAFTGISPRELNQIVPKFYGKTVEELREEANA